MGKFPSQPFDARLVASRCLAPAVREIVFERVDGAPFLFEPGQWVNLVLPIPSGEIKRAYSIASRPEEGSPRFALAITRVTGGPGSEYLHEIPVGETLRAIGPQGLFTRQGVEDAPSIFIGTGTGITPFRSMVDAALASGSKAPHWLLLGFRHEEDILYREDLERWQRDHENVRLEISLSQGGDAWKGRRGYVQTHLPELVGALRAGIAPADPHAYICGLERMVSAAKDVLRGPLAIPRKHVHTEKYD